MTLTWYSGSKDPSKLDAYHWCLEEFKVVEAQCSDLIGQYIDHSRTMARAKELT